MLPKPPALRQRRNRSATAATLPSEAEAARRTVPRLPARAGGPWHPKVVAWWRAVWRSPMAAEYLAADRGGLEILAELYQGVWSAPKGARALATLAAEIRHQETRFGLSPIDRRRLQWSIATAAPGPEKRPATRRAAKRPAPDPRDVLRVLR
ncbi:MAG: hypothetical protein AB7R55_13005 [Gemmatimonadales bacterium]